MAKKATGKKVAKRVRKPAKQAAHEPIGKPGHYEGKQHYPKMLYGKNEAGELVYCTVADADEERQRVVTEAAKQWKESPADHGVETHPAQQVLEDRKV